MAIEIERKFLLKGDAWRNQVQRSAYMAQGYLGGTRASVRVRVSGDVAWLNIKSQTRGSTRLEFEYPIPRADADVLLEQLADGPVVSKTRHYVEIDSHVFEIDEFDGANQGLIVAEIELGSADEAFPRPSWLGLEVTDDLRYYNLSLVKQPYSQWEQS
ncbi:MAG: CYTH domain-containing protein [Lysobacterales bacterium]|nr:CYTH domain-containing protein [Xanthomonadales bacterium]MCB1613276.1 CYTH domain-containing protein [Xanthomonadales bacterium]MCP5474560.1 CYTH domain-containing protein [Rhodanobacteraceae bacterium]